jgi:hypothetical protein
MPVLIASGKADPIVPASNSSSRPLLPVDHQLSQADLV